MQLYLTHSSNYDYRKELYEPLKQTIGKEHNIFLPHEEHNEGMKSSKSVTLF